MEYRPIVFKNDIVVPKKITEQIDFGMHTTVLIYVLNVGLGGGELKSIYKNMFVEFPCPSYYRNFIRFIYIFSSRLF